VNPSCNRWKHHTPRCLNAPPFTYLLYCTTYSKFLNPPHPVAQQPLVGQGCLITVASRSHSDALQSCLTTLDEWSARRKHPYLTTHNTHKRQTSMPPAGFKLTIPASKRRQTHALHHAASRICQNLNTVRICVAQLVEALHYKLEGLRFDSQWCHWNFSLT
jgi:hypothetical protein